MDEFARDSFGFGFRVAEHVHGIRRGFAGDTSESVREVLEAIARCELTLIDTPEEITAGLDPPQSARDQLRIFLRKSRENEREIAGLILSSMFGPDTQTRQ